MRTTLSVFIVLALAAGCASTRPEVSAARSLPEPATLHIAATLTANMTPQLMAQTGLPQTIKGTLEADNQTNRKITVKSMATAAVVEKLAGSWGMAVGDKSSAENIDFSPKSIDSGSKTTFRFTTPWHCSNNGGNTTETYADFKIQLVIDSDHGKYTVDLPTHRMKMP